MLQLDVLHLGKRLFCEQSNKRFTTGNLLILDSNAEVEEESVEPPRKAIKREINESVKVEEY